MADARQLSAETVQWWNAQEVADFFINGLESLHPTWVEDAGAPLNKTRLRRVVADQRLGGAALLKLALLPSSDQKTLLECLGLSDDYTHELVSQIQKQIGSLHLDESEEEGSEDEEDDDDDDDVYEEATWIEWFCSLKGNEFFAQVPEDYVQDDFHMTGLRSMVPYYDQALEILLDEASEDQEERAQHNLLESAAEILYGLVHSRFILTSRGLHQMREKYRRCEFGRCPRVLCHGAGVLPMGLTDIPQRHPVQVYCPQCADVYTPQLGKRGSVDGAFFGTTFAQLMTLTFPEIASVPQPPIYGFKVHIPKRKSPPTPRQASADTQGDDPAAGEKMVQDTKTKEAEEEVVGDDAK